MLRNVSRYKTSLLSLSRASTAGATAIPLRRTFPSFPHTHTTAAATAPFSSQSITMSDITKVHTTAASPPAGPYSQAIKANGQIFVSGQIPADSSATLIEGSIGQKTEASCNNIKAILEAAGSSLDKVLKVNIFLTDMANFAEMNATYEKFFTSKPARSCVAVAQLPKGVPVEIECIALA